MRKAGAKLQKKLQPYKKIANFMGTKVIFSLFTLLFSLYFVSLQLISVSKSYS